MFVQIDVGCQDSYRKKSGCLCSCHACRVFLSHKLLMLNPNSNEKACPMFTDNWLKLMLWGDGLPFVIIRAKTNIGPIIWHTMFRCTSIVFICLCSAVTSARAQECLQPEQKRPKNGSMILIISIAGRCSRIRRHQHAPVLWAHGPSENS